MDVITLKVSSITVLMFLRLYCVTGLNSKNQCMPVFNDSMQVYSPLGRSSGLSPLYFGLMVAPTEDSDYVNATLTAVQLALNEINANSDLLRGYSLHYSLTVSQVILKQGCNQNVLYGGAIKLWERG